MVRSQVIYHLIIQISAVIFLLFLLAICPFSFLSAQDRGDSTRVLKKVTVTASPKQNAYLAAVPVQILDQERLQELNAESIADAAKYFSGVLIKDYGGVGGLKTISVRSLGALNTGILYDGVPVADAQTGQIDLSKFSAIFVQTLELDQTNPQQILLPARAYSAASILAITTNSYHIASYTQKKWVAGFDEGSFGLYQPYAGFCLPAGKTIVITANAEAIWDKGNYPYFVNNGIFSQKAYRINSDINSNQEEANLVKKFSDSSVLQTKIWAYSSDRGLPGSIIFFNDISVQRLWDRDYFVQSRYQKKISDRTALLVSAKFSSLFTRYRDPDFLNNAGGLDDRYYQTEIYGSASLSQQIGKNMLVAVASDIASTHLSANITPFATPTRTSLWNSIAMQYAISHWQINISLLNTNIHDMTETGTASANQNKFTPTIAASYKPKAVSPFLFRFFYKDIFRMPTFNDLYYNYTFSIDPKLLPEFSKQYNAGITYSKNINRTLQQFAISADGYYISVKNKIVAVPSQNLFIWTMENLGKAEIRGVDINAEAKGKFSEKISWSARIAGTIQKALDMTDPTSAEYKNEIPYTPDHSGSALLAMYYKKWDAGYSLLFSGSRYALGVNDPSSELPGWVTHDFYVSRMIEIWGFGARIKAELNNFLDERYEVIRYYPMPGRSYKISFLFKNL
jgi:vitamin B12 transporter